MKMYMPNVCRTCLRISRSDFQFFNLETVFPPNDDINLRQKLSSCVPELSLDNFDAVICNLCFNALHSAYAFKKMCLETETRIRKYVLKYRNLDFHNLDNQSFHPQSCNSFSETFRKPDGSVKNEQFDSANFKEDIDIIEHDVLKPPFELGDNNDSNISQVEEVEVKVYDKKSDMSDEDINIDNNVDNNTECKYHPPLFESIIDLDTPNECHFKQYNANCTEYIIQKACKTIPLLKDNPDSLKCYVLIEKLDIKVLDVYSNINDIDKLNLLSEENQCNDHNHAKIEKNTDTSGKPYICLLCPKRFKMKAHLKRHELFHRKNKSIINTSYKPHVCLFCPKHFKMKGHLKRHELFHKKNKNTFLKVNESKVYNNINTSASMEVVRSLKDYKNLEKKKSLFPSLTAAEDIFEKGMISLSLYDIPLKTVKIPTVNEDGNCVHVNLSSIQPQIINSCKGISSQIFDNGETTPTSTINDDDSVLRATPVLELIPLNKIQNLDRLSETLCSGEKAEKTHNRAKLSLFEKAITDDNKEVPKIDEFAKNVITFLDIDIADLIHFKNSIKYCEEFLFAERKQSENGLVNKKLLPADFRKNLEDRLTSTNMRNKKRTTLQSHNYIKHLNSAKKYNYFNTSYEKIKSTFMQNVKCIYKNVNFIAVSFISSKNKNDIHFKTSSLKSLKNNLIVTNKLQTKNKKYCENFISECKSCMHVFKRGRLHICKHSRYNNHETLVELQNSCLITDPNKCFKCKICKKIFVTVRNLKLHIRIHEDFYKIKGRVQIRHFKCNICKRLFKGYNCLKFHYWAHQKVNCHSSANDSKYGKAVHKCSKAIELRNFKETTLFLCEICGMSYKQTGVHNCSRRSNIRVNKYLPKVRKYLNICKNLPYKCNGSKETFKLKTQFAKHRPKCSVTNLAIVGGTQSSLLINHINSISENALNGFNAEKEDLISLDLMNVPEGNVNELFDLERGRNEDTSENNIKDLCTNNEINCIDCKCPENISFHKCNNIGKNKKSTEVQSTFDKIRNGNDNQCITEIVDSKEEKLENKSEDSTEENCNKQEVLTRNLKGLGKNWCNNNINEECKGSELKSFNSCTSRDETKQAKSSYKLVCTICNKTFKQSIHLKLHFNVHTLEKPFKCYMCSFQSSQNYAVNSHIKKVHKVKAIRNAKKINSRCNICNQNFYTRLSLRMHTNQYACESFYCKICLENFTSSCHEYVHKTQNSSLFVQNKVNISECFTCKKSFGNVLFLSDHLKENLSDFFCIFCNTNFKLLCHKSVHNNSLQQLITEKHGINETQNTTLESKTEQCPNMPVQQQAPFVIAGGSASVEVNNQLVDGEKNTRLRKKQPITPVIPRANASLELETDCNKIIENRLIFDGGNTDTAKFIKLDHGSLNKVSHNEKGEMMRSIKKEMEIESEISHFAKSYVNDNAIAHVENHTELGPGQQLNESVPNFNKNVYICTTTCIDNTIEEVVNECKTLKAANGKSNKSESYSRHKVKYCFNKLNKNSKIKIGTRIRDKKQTVESNIDSVIDSVINITSEVHSKHSQMEVVTQANYISIQYALNEKCCPGKTLGSIVNNKCVASNIDRVIEEVISAYTENTDHDEIMEHNHVFNESYTERYFSPKYATAPKSSLDVNKTALFENQNTYVTTKVIDSSQLNKNNAFEEETLRSYIDETTEVVNRSGSTVETGIDLSTTEETVGKYRVFNTSSISDNQNFEVFKCECCNLNFYVKEQFKFHRKSLAHLKQKALLKRSSLSKNDVFRLPNKKAETLEELQSNVLEIMRKIDLIKSMSKNPKVKQ